MTTRVYPSGRFRLSTINAAFLYSMTLVPLNLIFCMGTQCPI